MNNNENYFQNKYNKNFELKNKVEQLKNELLDKEKCKKFSLMLCKYIKENPSN